MLMGPKPSWVRVQKQRDDEEADQPGCHSEQNCSSGRSDRRFNVLPWNYHLIGKGSNRVIFVMKKGSKLNSGVFYSLMPLICPDRSKIGRNCIQPGIFARFTLRPCDKTMRQ